VEESRREKSRKRVETIRDERKEKKGEYTESNGGKEVFCL